MGSLIIRSSGTLKHLNIRKEGQLDDKLLGIDVKLSECPCSIEFLARVLGNEYQHLVRNAFWDEDGNPRFLTMEPITSWANYSDLDVTIADMKFTGCHAKKFKLALEAGPKPKVEFQLSINNPSSREVAILAELVADDVDFLVTRSQQELDFAVPKLQVVPPGSSPNWPPSFEEQQRDLDELDDLVNDAAAYVIESQRVSVSSLQRKLRIGYNRAARVVEQLETLRIVSAPETDGSRVVLVAPKE